MVCILFSHSHSSYTLITLDYNAKCLRVIVQRTMNGRCDCCPMEYGMLPMESLRSEAMYTSKERFVAKK